MSAHRVITESDIRLRSIGEQVDAAIESVRRACALSEIGPENMQALTDAWLEVGRSALAARRAIVARALKAAAEEAA